ncbi:MAG TPA: response regulator [Acetobacteraceae bacterium]|nr:response regulator [Acetobacteraceae bacterium]
MRLSTRLLLVVLTCLLPVILLGIWVEYSHWEERRAQLGDLSLQQAQLLNGDIDSITDGARTLLSAIAQFDEVRDATPTCGERLRATQRGLPMFAFVALLDADGLLICASESALRLAEGARPQWVGDAIVTKGFAPGRFSTAAGVSDGFLPFTFPLAEIYPDRDGVLVAGLDLKRLSEHLSRLRQTGSPFLAGSVLTVADSDGVILARSSRHEDFVGKRFPPQAMALVTAPQAGIKRLKSIDGTTRVIGYIPISQSPVGLMVASGFDEAAMMADINRASLRGGLLLAGVAIGALLLTLFVARRFIARPTRALLAAARRWREGDLATPVHGEDAHSEFGQIAAAYNDMARALARREEDLREHADVLEARVAERTEELLVTNNRLQVEIAERQNAEAALVQSQKLQAVGQLAGGIAHDFNNLLATIQGSLDLLSKTVPPKEERQHTWIGRATGAVYRGSQLTGRLLAFSRRQRLAVRASDVNKLVSDLVPLLRTCTDGQRIRIDIRLGDDLWPAMVEPSQVEAAILNLALNARDAMQDGGVLTIATANQPVTDAMQGDVTAGDYVSITVTDTGVGMTDEVAQRAFEPFFTTKGPSGSGLGLSQVYGMVRESGGTVRLMTSPGGGTSVALLLPRAAQMPTPDRPQTEQRRVQAGARVLVVDDDPEVLQVSADMLRQLGYRVTTAASGREALAALDAQPTIVLLDHAMPAMTGLEVASAMRERGYAGPIILATGYAELGEAEQDKLATLQGVLNKPYSIRDLETLLARVEMAVADAGLQPVK